jgi:hypothetical protein
MHIQHTTYTQHTACIHCTLTTHSLHTHYTFIDRGESWCVLARLFLDGGPCGVPTCGRQGYAR